MICSSLNRFRFMSALPERTRLYYVRVSGAQVDTWRRSGMNLAQSVATAAQAKDQRFATIRCNPR